MESFSNFEKLFETIAHTEYQFSNTLFHKQIINLN